MGKDKLKLKSIMTRDEAAAYLETILAGLKQGSLILDSEERPLILRPSDSIEAELEIKQKSDKEKVEVKLSWAPNRMQPLTSVAAPADSPADDAAKKKMS